MNLDSQKDKPNENLPKVEESASVYCTKADLRKGNSDTDWDNLPEILQQLIEKGIKQCDEGELIPHEKVMSDIKKRFNIS
ncbi:hypothetical protein [Flavobacterium gilvum]|uniref:Uncharacterized protein n=1 Tax=Flavobacterium gilvum TaxID=1492737 RepID=A0AAC9I845_9FLAO|nr:hypothetical protein [Flavobacterium gilvum]AOW10998.1 hypothetical protein EM308_16735 [Flavobacterium gilvum]KFC58142.1 hypothetical protein FEM08_30970 [Flavobacterium gilvum]